jgi:hypothetical protein
MKRDGGSLPVSDWDCFAELSSAPDSVETARSICLFSLYFIQKLKDGCIGGIDAQSEQLLNPFFS